MTIASYLILLCLALAVSAVCDSVWLRYLRPLLARSHGWPDVRADERIPAIAWVGALLIVSTLFIFVPFVGVSAGY